MTFLQNYTINFYILYNQVPQDEILRQVFFSQDNPDRKGKFKNYSDFILACHEDIGNLVLFFETSSILVLTFSYYQINFLDIL